MKTQFNLKKTGNNKSFGFNRYKGLSGEFTDIVLFGIVTRVWTKTV